jgi:glutathione S-transferase
MPTLLTLHYSPWSEKARWALDHHQIGYTEKGHLPLINEPFLRYRARGTGKKPTIPALLENGHAIFDSYAIARRAEALGKGAPLFPEDELEAIEQWNARSEEAMQAARAMVVLRLASDEDALREALPGFLRPLGPVGLVMGRMGSGFIAWKYRVRDASIDDRKAVLERVLRDLRRALEGGKETLLDGFTYADIAMSTVLQFVQPVDDRYLEIGLHTRRRFTMPELAKEYADLVAWRDRLYAKHRQ